MLPVQIQRELDKLLPSVRKPGRYTGGELNQIVKDWDKTDVHIALAFPDIYDLGMSNLGLMILYDIINKHGHIWSQHCGRTQFHYSRWKRSTR
jgi:hypothetical protein